MIYCPCPWGAYNLAVETDISRQFYYNVISAVREVYSECYGSPEKDTQPKTSEVS